MASGGLPVAEQGNGLDLGMDLQPGLQLQGAGRAAGNPSQQPLVPRHQTQVYTGLVVLVQGIDADAYPVENAAVRVRAQGQADIPGRDAQPQRGARRALGPASQSCWPTSRATVVSWSAAQESTTRLATREIRR